MVPIGYGKERCQDGQAKVTGTTKVFREAQMNMLPAVRMGVAMIAVAVMLPSQAAESESGSVCIAPVFEKPDGMSAPGLFCESGKLSVRIDTQPVVAFPLISERHGTFESRRA
jgi:hypothetical protein